MPCMYKALGSVPRTANNRNKDKLHRNWKHMRAETSNTSTKPNKKRK